MDDNSDRDVDDSGAEYQDAEVDLECPSISEDSESRSVNTLRPLPTMRSKAFEHPLYKGDNFEVRAGEREMGLVLTVPRGKRVSVRFSIDKWETTQEVKGERLGVGREDDKGCTDRLFFRVPVGVDATRVLCASDGRQLGGGVDFAVRYLDEDTT